MSWWHFHFPDFWTARTFDPTCKVTIDAELWWQKRTRRQEVLSCTRAPALQMVCEFGREMWRTSEEPTLRTEDLMLGEEEADNWRIQVAGPARGDCLSEWWHCSRAAATTWSWRSDGFRSLTIPDTGVIEGVLLTHLQSQVEPSVSGCGAIPFSFFFF